MKNPLPVGTIVKSHFASPWQGEVVKDRPRTNIVKGQYSTDGWLVQCRITHDRNGLPLRKPTLSSWLSTDWLRAVKPNDVLTSKFVSTVKSKHKSNISVLPLKAWMEAYIKSLEKGHATELEEITPVFNRTGWYRDRIQKKEWFEVNGRAFLNDTYGELQLEIKLYDFQNLTAEEIEAFKVLSKNKNLLSRFNTKKDEIFNLLNHYNQLKEIRRLTAGSRLRIRKLIDKVKKERKNAGSA